MSSMGIIANPASGKDIRRLVSHATVIDNNEKINMMERIILGAQQCGVDRIYIMPETNQMGYKALDKLQTAKELTAQVEILDMRISATAGDSTMAARMLEEMKVGCLVVLGGDGTHRAVAKGIHQTPLIGISTGTNNVYPEMVEGTVAGMAAGVVASGRFARQDVCKKDKRIEIYRNGSFMDIALVDAVISKSLVRGAKAIWDMEDMEKVFVSRCHPASIGFSSVLGMKLIVREEDDFGACADINARYCELMAPVGAGLVMPICIGKPEKLPLDVESVYMANFAGMIAVDGEREIEFEVQDHLAFRITRNGPYHVDVKKTLEMAQQSGYFERPL